MQSGTGFHVAIEVKLPGKENTLTEKQNAWLWRVKRKSLNARVGMATTVQQAIRIIEGLERQEFLSPRSYSEMKRSRRRKKASAKNLEIDPGAIGR